MNVSRSGFLRRAVAAAPLVLLASLPCAIQPAGAAELTTRVESGNVLLRVLGDRDDEWRFEKSSDLLNWTNAPALGAV